MFNNNFTAGSRVRTTHREGLREKGLSFLKRRIWFAEDDETETEDETPEIDWSQISVEDIPVDLIKESQLYQDIKDESIQQRQKYKKLRDQMRTQQTEEEDSAEEEPDEPENNGNNDPIFSREDVAQVVADVLSAELAEREERSNTVRSILQEYGLTEDHLDLIQDDDPDIMRAKAEKVASLSGVSSQTQRGNKGRKGGKPADPNQELVDRIKARVNNAFEGTNVFNSDFNQQMGGGVVEISNDQE